MPRNRLTQLRPWITLDDVKLVDRAVFLPGTLHGALRRMQEMQEMQNR
jgi:hypothetical protein